MKKLKSNRGITLIALIITIIVMLILVAVTVNIVINSGLLNTTKRVAQDYKRGEDTDNISSMYMGYTIAKHTSNDPVTLLSYFQEQVEKGNIASATADGEDVIIELANGNSYRVTEDGQISVNHTHTWTETGTVAATCTAAGSTSYQCSECGQTKTVTIAKLPHNFENGECTVCGEPEPQEVEIETIAAAPTTYYGKTVNYTADVDNTITWQLFYVDSTNKLIYLIASDMVDITKTTSLKTELNDVGDSDNYVIFSTSVRGYSGIITNSAYNYSDEYVFNSNSTYNNQIKGLLSYFNNPVLKNAANIRSTVFMLTSSKWSEYLDNGGNGKAAWVIGGPTLDVFAESYNQFYNGQTVLGKTTHIYYDYITTGQSRGYNIGSTETPLTGSYHIDNLAKPNIQLYESNTGTYWIASPVAGSHGNYYQLASANLYGSNLQLGASDDCNQGNYGVRPLVCLKSNVKLTKDPTLKGTCDFGLTTAE